MRQILVQAQRIVAEAKFRADAAKLGVRNVTVEEVDGTTNDHWTMVFRFQLANQDGYDFRIPYGVFWGCCGMKIVHEARFSWGFQRYRKGIGSLFMQAFMQAMQDAEMPGQLLAATTNNQPTATAWLAKLGWTKRGTSFVNPQTEARVTLWGWKVPSGKGKDKE